MAYDMVRPCDQCGEYYYTETECPECFPPGPTKETTMKNIIYMALLCAFMLGAFWPESAGVRFFCLIAAVLLAGYNGRLIREFEYKNFGV